MLHVREASCGEQFNIETTITQHVKFNPANKQCKVIKRKANFPSIKPSNTAYYRI